MRVHVVDPSAYTPSYDHALCEALGRAGAIVELVTSSFAYGSVPAASHYVRRELFYRHARGAAGSRLRTAAKALEHLPDMVRYRRAALAAEVVHFQWLAIQWLDHRLLPDRPVVLTAHDLLPREPSPGQVRGQRRLYGAVDAVVVHSEYGRRSLVEEVGVAPQRIHVIRHGAFGHLVHQPDERPLPAELAAIDSPVALFFGLLRPYKGLRTLLRAWEGMGDAELWIVGRPRMELEPLQAVAPPGARFVPRYVSDLELPAFFRRAEVVVLPYSHTERFDFSGVLATALAFGKPTILTDVGSFEEVASTGAARLIPPDDPAALRAALQAVLGDDAERQRLAAAARAAAAGPYSWTEASRRTLELYQGLLGGTAPQSPPP